MRLAIWKGMKHRETYKLPASGSEITIRPLSQIEVDQAYATALDSFPRSVQKIVVKFHAGVANKDTPIPDDVRIGDVQLYYNTVGYHLFSVSTGMPVEEVKQLPYGDKIRDYVDRILRISGVNQKQAFEDVESFLINSDGLVLAQLVTKLGVPLTDEAWKLTPLQIRFLTEDHEEFTRVVSTQQAFGMVSAENGGRE